MNQGRADDRWALIGQCPPADLRGVRLGQRLPESHAGSHRTQVRQQSGGDQVLRPGPVPQTRVLTAAPRSRTFTPNRADSRVSRVPDGRKCNNNDLQAGRDFPSEHKDFDPRSQSSFVLLLKFSQSEIKSAFNVN